MLKNVNSDDSVNRKCYFETLVLVFTTLMFTADCIDNDVIVEVIDLGRNFTTNIDDAESILKLSLSTIAWRTQGKSYPIDKCIAFAIKSGLLDMCFEFLSRFACDPTIQLRACDPIRHDRDDLMVLLVSIAAFIQAVDLHQKTAKAIRDARSQIIKMLTPLMTQERNEKSFMFQFVDILSSILDLNEGSCSCCNTPIVWRTALFCGGCRRVAYCGLKCQKSDWRYGSHSSECSFLARSADVLGLTTFNVRRRRNISTLTGLRNNIVTSQYKLFLRHEDKLSTQLLTYQDRIDYIARFNLSLFLRPISFVHYHDHFTCPRQRKWFEDFRSPDRVLCMFTSDVFNGELDKDEYINMISLYAAFPIPNIIQSGFKLYATATMKDLHNSTKFNSNELYLTVGNMYKSLSKEERIYWDKQAALELVDSSSSIPPHTRAEALKATGNGYFKTGDYKSAVEMYKSAATINSSDPTHWSNLAASYEKLGILLADEPPPMKKSDIDAMEVDDNDVKIRSHSSPPLRRKVAGPISMRGGAKGYLSNDPLTSSTLKSTPFSVVRRRNAKKNAERDKKDMAKEKSRSKISERFDSSDDESTQNNYDDIANVNIDEQEFLREVARKRAQREEAIDYCSTLAQ